MAAGALNLAAGGGAESSSSSFRPCGMDTSTRSPWDRRRASSDSAPAGEAEAVEVNAAQRRMEVRKGFINSSPRITLSPFSRCAQQRMELAHLKDQWMG